MFLYYLNFFYLKLNLLKIDPKMCTFKNLEEILKTLKNLPKTFSNPDNMSKNILKIINPKLFSRKEG